MLLFLPVPFILMASPITHALSTMHVAHGPLFHILASEATHTQTVRITVHVRKRPQLHIVAVHSTFIVVNVLIDHFT
jgi:hypothetical protein